MHLAGQLLASCSADKTVRLWRATTSAAPAAGVNQQHIANGASLSAQPADALTASQHPAQQQVQTRMPQGAGAWQCVAILEDAHSRTIRSISWSPDGKQLAMASFDATTSIWACNNSKWEQVAVLEGHENEVKGVAWCPDGVHIATCGRDKTVWIWESLPGYEYECVDVKQGHQQDVKMVVWHPGGEQLASCSYDDSIKCWTSDGDEWNCTQTLAGSAAGGVGHDSTVWAVSYNAQGTGMVSCSDDCTLKFWKAAPGGHRVPTWQLATTVSGYHSRAIFSVDWAKTEPYWVVTGDGDNCIRVFGPSPADSMDVSHDHSSTQADAAVPTSWQQLLCQEGAHSADVNCVRWHPTISGMLASCGDDGIVRIWQVNAADVC